MQKILIIQFRQEKSSIEHEQACFDRELASEEVSLQYVSAFHNLEVFSQPAALLSGVSGVILGGSGEFDFDGGRPSDDVVRLASYDAARRFQSFVTYLQENNIPTLAICYGHQLLAASSGVVVVNDTTQAKAGSHVVYLTDIGINDPLFADIPATFIAQYGHKDSLSLLPENATLLATGDACRFSAIRYKKCCYSVQFHPELSAIDVIQKFASNPSYLPPGISAKEIVQDSPFSTKILKNFLKRCTQNI